MGKPGMAQAGQRRQQLRSLGEPAEGVDGRGGRALRTKDLAAFNLLAGSGTKRADDVIRFYTRQELNGRSHE